MEKKGVCQNCDRRYVGCHSTCEDYLDWIAYNRAQKEYIYNQKREDNLVRSYKRVSVDRARKRRGK